jgi:hypothetical protein
MSLHSVPACSFLREVWGHFNSNCHINQVQRFFSGFVEGSLFLWCFLMCILVPVNFEKHTFRLITSSILLGSFSFFSFWHFKTTYYLTVLKFFRAIFVLHFLSLLHIHLKSFYCPFLKFTYSSLSLKVWWTLQRHSSFLLLWFWFQNIFFWLFL